MSKKSSSPHFTSAINWRMAEVFLGPRHRMAWSLSCKNVSMEMTDRFSLYAAGIISWVGSSISTVLVRPNRLGTLGP